MEEAGATCAYACAQVGLAPTSFRFSVKWPRCILKRRERKKPIVTAIVTTSSLIINSDDQVDELWPSVHIAVRGAIHCTAQGPPSPNVASPSPRDAGLRRLKMRDRKMRDGQKCRGEKCRTGKCGTRLQGWKMRDWKMRDQYAGVENAAQSSVESLSAVCK